MSFIQMSLTGAIMAVAVIIIRALFIHRVPKRAFVVLWGLVLCRLLLPFDISAPTSIFVIGQHIQGKAQPTMMFETLDPEIMANSDSIYTWHYAQAAIDQQASAAEGLTPAPPTVPLLAIIWLAGVVLSGTYFAVLYIRHRRKFSTSLPLENEFIANWLQTHTLKKRQIRVRTLDRISTPLTYGVFSPVILLPKNTNLQDEKGLSHILAHEFIHIKRLDALTKLFMTAAVCVHWFNPLVWVMYVMFNRDLEISCDEAVVKLFGEETKSQYALTLLCAKSQNSYPPLHTAFSKCAIEERIHAIMRIRKASVAQILVAFLLIVSTTMVFATSAAPIPAHSYNISARIVDTSNRAPGAGFISAEEAATIGRVAFSRYFPAFAQDWEDWESVTFVMNFEGYSKTRNTNSVWAVTTAPLWQGMIIIDTDGPLGHKVPFNFSIHARTGEVLLMRYSPQTRYTAIVEDAFLNGTVAAVFAEWNEIYHAGDRAGRHNAAFKNKAWQIAEQIEFFDSEIVSVQMHRVGTIASGPTGTVRVEYASGDIVQLEFLMFEEELVSVMYLRV